MPKELDERVAPSIAFYGDDFTGATDTLATAARAGLRSMLFLRPPTAAQRSAAGPLDCLGIAGAARSMQPDAQQQELQEIGRYFAELGAPVTHYKTCSTFDSSPSVGSIGLAARVLRAALGSPRFMPVIGGQPNLGRYCVFGNLFAAFRTGGDAYRLDRHPTMSRHPVTPMHEADLRLHLAEQGMARMGAVQYPAYHLAREALDVCVEQAIEAGPDGVLFDVAAPEQLAVIGRILWQHARRERLLAIGPSSVATALIDAWHEGRGGQGPFQGKLTAHSDLRGGRPGSDLPSDHTPIAQASARNAAGPVLVFSGSLSPLTASQIDAATSYCKIPVAADALLASDSVARDVARQAVLSALDAGQHVLAHVVGRTQADPAMLAGACGQLLASVLQRVRPRRVGVAGGDTSSHAVQALDVWGLSYLGQVDHGAALCRLHADAPQLAGLEIMLKGGQMGALDIFEKLACR